MVASFLNTNNGYHEKQKSASSKNPFPTPLLIRRTVRHIVPTWIKAPEELSLLHNFAEGTIRTHTPHDVRTLSGFGDGRLGVDDRKRLPSLLVDLSPQAFAAHVRLDQCKT